MLASHDTWFTPMLPILFIISVGTVACAHALLYGLCIMLCVILERVNLPTWITRKNETSSHRWKRKIITMGFLFFFVWVWVPWQFAFVVSSLVHLGNSIRSLLMSRRTKVRSPTLI